MIEQRFSALASTMRELNRDAPRIEAWGRHLAQVLVESVQAREDVAEDVDVGSARDLCRVEVGHDLERGHHANSTAEV